MLISSAKSAPHAVMADGVTIRVSLPRVPGMDNLPLISQGKVLQGLLRPGWMRGVPGVEITTLPGRSPP